MLHLAFKGQTTEDIYDTMVFCFMKAARQYDPYYADKTRKVCKELLRPTEAVHGRAAGSSSRL
jgi:hypothetical protein